MSPTHKQNNVANDGSSIAEAWRCTSYTVCGKVWRRPLINILTFMKFPNKNTNLESRESNTEDVTIIVCSAGISCFVFLS
jgi:hypothetical protein